jgi:hypothetical protein
MISVWGFTVGVSVETPTKLSEAPRSLPQFIRANTDMILSVGHDISFYILFNS